MVLEGCNIRKIKESGQCFRMFSLYGSEKDYFVVAGGNACTAKLLEGNSTEINCEINMQDFWMRYFDMETDYSDFKEQGKSDNTPFIRSAVTFGEGLRLVNQEPFECLISFIISQRKSIPAIRNCIELLCERYGRYKTSTGCGYYAFPTPEALRRGYEEDGYEGCGLGYRDEYVYLACDGYLKMREELLGYQSGSHSAEDYFSVLERLKSLRGVGDKVANCTILYSLGFKNVFPVDIWIQRVLDTYFTEDSFRGTSEKYMGMLGILQLYMFYYIRNIKVNK